MSRSATAPFLLPLAILPNGEAVRPERLLGITIEPAVALYDCEVERFDVVAHMVDGTARKVAERLLRPAAESVASEAAEAVNRAFRYASSQTTGGPRVRVRDAGGSP
jgi:hypothetical protein